MREFLPPMWVGEKLALKTGVNFDDNCAQFT